MSPKLRPYTIAIDFDGTLVTHAYPLIGHDIGAFKWLRELQKQRPDVRLILYTMRSGVLLEDAVQCCIDNGLDLWGVNDNPEQSTWTSSKKIYANLYIDDAAFGIPLRGDDSSDRPYVDWEQVGPELLPSEYGT